MLPKSAPAPTENGSNRSLRLTSKLGCTVMKMWWACPAREITIHYEHSVCGNLRAQVSAAAGFPPTSAQSGGSSLHSHRAPREPHTAERQQHGVQWHHQAVLSLFKDLASIFRDLTCMYMCPWRLWLVHHNRKCVMSVRYSLAWKVGNVCLCLFVFKMYVLNLGQIATGIHWFWLSLCGWYYDNVQTSDERLLC